MATTAQGIARVPGGLVRCTAVVPLPVTAVANTDYVFQLPCGARDVRFEVMTATAYAAATDAQLQIGKTVGGAEYSAAATIKAQGAYAPALVASGVPDLDSVPGSWGSFAAFTARLVQSGAASAVGQATLYAHYSMAA